MENFHSYLAAIVATGVGATAIADIWGWVRKPLLGVAPPNYCLVGRWFGHMPRGTFRHQPITAARPIAGECLVGWVAHYLIGIAYAGILIVGWGLAWVEQPTLAPALIVGVVTLLAPFLVMQPALGAGIASAKLPNPAAARLHSFTYHLVFGFGLYLAGLVVCLVWA